MEIIEEIKMSIEDMLKDKIMLSSMIILATTGVSFVALGMFDMPTLYLIGGIFFIATGIVGLIWACIRKRWVEPTNQMTYEELRQKICNDIKKISPETARRIAKHIPKIESILRGENNLDIS